MFQEARFKFYCFFWIVNPFQFWSKTITWCSRRFTVGFTIWQSFRFPCHGCFSITSWLYESILLNNFGIHHCQNTFYNSNNFKSYFKLKKNKVFISIFVFYIKRTIYLNFTCKALFLSFLLIHWIQYIMVKLVVSDILFSVSVAFESDFGS